MDAVHFDYARDFRHWLEEHHANATELHVAFYRKATGRAGMTYAEAVDEALCFGWIDGVVRRIDDTRYQHRFTPRKRGSIWSNVNVRHVARLTAAGRMMPAGLAAFAARSAAKTGIYSFESEPKKLPAKLEREFRVHAKAWTFFQAQAPWYRRVVIHKIVSAKQEATQRRWLQRAIDDSAAGRRIASISPATKR